MTRNATNWKMEWEISNGYCLPLFLISLFLHHSVFSVTDIQKGITFVVKYLPAENEVWGEVILSQACVIPSDHGGRGVCIEPVRSASREGSASRGVCMQGGLHPGVVCMGGGERSASRGVGQISPRILRDTVNERAVHILLDCSLVSIIH